MKIDNRVENCELIEFSKLKWFQGDLKEIKKDGALTLKNAIEDAYIDPFAVWIKSPDDIKILNGHQRHLIMKDNDFNGKVPYFSVKCRNDKEAAKFVLYFDSKPGRITEEGLYKFMHEHELVMEDFKDNVDFAEIDLDYFADNYFNELDLGEPKEKEIDELETENKCPKCGYEW
jgi:hypothetical protein